jgi:hypothetical protein
MSPGLTAAGVPQYVNAIFAVYSVVDSMGADDFLRRLLETLASALEQRIDVAGLSAEAERVAARMRAEKAGVDPALDDLDSGPNPDHRGTTFEDRWKMKREWRQTSAFQEMRETFRGVIANQMAYALAEGGVDLAKAATMTDAELLKVPRMGLVTVGKLRRFLAEREQYEEEEEAA